MAMCSLSDSGCLVFSGAMGRDGYGRTGFPDGRKVLVHRLMYETFVGVIPEGLDIDHLCRNRACCRVDHLQPVTRRENAHRGVRGVLTTHCPHGHAYDAENTHVTRAGHRQCRACWRRKRAAEKLGKKTH